MNARAAGLALCTLLITFGTAGAENGIGLGIIAGEPTGISIKKWLSQKHAFGAAAAWSISDNDKLQFHVDYLFHRFAVLTSDTEKTRLPIYYGLGGRMKVNARNGKKGRKTNDALIGVRIPFGMNYLLATAPIDLFAEIVPVLDLVPSTEMDVNGAVGIRLWFR